MDTSGDPVERTGGQDFSVMVTGDVILNHRASVATQPEFRAVVDLIHAADIVHMQFEGGVADFARPDVFPAAEGPLYWFGGPEFIADELRWLGGDIVSTASNHTVDLSYGGLFSTISALDRAGLVHAGTGKDLATARRAGYVDTPHARVGLVSASSSFPQFARAGDARGGFPGRPGVNPLRFVYRVDEETADAAIRHYRGLGYWVTQLGQEFAVNPAGLHNTLTRFMISGEPGISTVPDDDDLAGNLAAIREAAGQADVVIAHLHAHEFDGTFGYLSKPAAFIETYGRASIDAGAHIVIAEGSHAPMRGLEIYRGRPIFYDPGDLAILGDPDQMPGEFYTRWGMGELPRQPNSTLTDAYAAAAPVFFGDALLSPLTTYSTTEASVYLPICRFTPAFDITEIEIYPIVRLKGSKAITGLPARAHGSEATRILTHLAELSEPYGTKLDIRDEIGHVAVS